MWSIIWTTAKTLLSQPEIRKLLIGVLITWFLTSGGCVTVGRIARKWEAHRAYKQGYRQGLKECDKGTSDDDESRPWGWRFLRPFGVGQSYDDVDVSIIQDYEPTLAAPEIIEAPKE